PRLCVCRRRRLAELGVPPQMARFLRPHRQMKHVRFLCALAVLVGCAFALGGCGKPSVDSAANASAETVPRTAIRFQTDWYPQPEHGGFYQALARGFYAEARLDVSILPGGPGPKTTAKIAGGSADVAMGRSDDI